VVNKPSAMASNDSKPTQSILIAGCGFRTPEMIVTNVPRQAWPSRVPLTIKREWTSLQDVATCTGRLRCGKHDIGRLRFRLYSTVGHLLDEVVQYRNEENRNYRCG
jgi:hypothetical protein